jgi:hypothetical protein
MPPESLRRPGDMFTSAAIYKSGIQVCGARRVAGQSSVMNIVKAVSI